MKGVSFLKKITLKITDLKRIARLYINTINNNT